MVRTGPSIGHLSKDMQAFYRRIDRTYQLEARHHRLLVLACEAHDRAVEARDRLRADGLTIRTRHGETRAHPCVAIERDSAIRFSRLMRELGLRDEGPDTPRPPALTGRYQGRA